METGFGNAITDVPGILVGHAQDDLALTGCTVVLYPAGAVGGVDQRGGAPGTRETDAMHPMHLVREVHGVVLTGGSAFGLESATGVVRYLEEQGVGFMTGAAKVPIVPAAVLYDLGIGRADVRPDAAMGYQACQNATDSPPGEGNLGAGCGATVGKILGTSQATKSGVGTASVQLGAGLVVGALMAVNAFGDVLDPKSGEILAGARTPGATSGQPLFADTLEVLRQLAQSPGLTFGRRGNTVIGVIATNALLDKEGASKVAQMAHDGLARCIRPAHTMVDGDTIFCMATGELEADVNLVGAFAAEVTTEAILRSVKAAGPAGGLPSLSALLR